MKQHLLQGWKLSTKHFPIVILLFLYQLLWGFFLYRSVSDIVVPLLKRYPDTMPTDSAVKLFLMEAQFRLVKTDLIEPYLWMLGALFISRMLLTPFIHAGLLYSIHHTQDERGTHFLRGIRQAWKPVFALYLIEMLLLLAPAWHLLPKGSQLLYSSGSLEQLLLNLLPYAAAWIAWGGLLHLLFRAVQFGVVAKAGVWKSMTASLRCLVPLAGISIILLAISLGVGLAVSAVSLIWAGLFALILHQSLYLVRALLKVWTLACQYRVWQGRHSQSD
ncbi:hypothetical protein ACFOQM_05125 [Paenibacillus sp. GCM10012307]|uniref:Uncharacterized protein n=1 Tax=Paenibacillus roseus TaxID=2798579 RepID=A0A934MU36_9BACL|nr:hypothetical protein [Paenibacillus roseus]MBJ6360687.1 hypothetical protein [Paenibacillus roseus]